MSLKARAAPGFTLIEALVALALVLAFAAAAGPLLFQGRRIMDRAERRVAAHVLLRSLLDASFDRSASAIGVPREGEAAGLRWRIVAAPIFLAALPPRQDALWMPVRVTATVSWGAGQAVTAETVRLARTE